MKNSAHFFVRISTCELATSTDCLGLGNKTRWLGLGKGLQGKGVGEVTIEFYTRHVRRCW